MKRIFKNFAIILMYFVSASVIAQYKNVQMHIDIPRYQIKQDKFFSILDSIILHESNCKYYSNKIVFSLDIGLSKSICYLKIESIDDISVLLGLKPYGYFIYDDHLFFLDGKLCTNLFAIINENKMFCFEDYIYAPNDPESVPLYLEFNDSFSRWFYVFTDSKFILTGHDDTCD